MDSTPSISQDRTLADSLAWLERSRDSKSPALAKLFAQRLLDHIDGQARTIEYLREKLAEREA